MKELFRACVTFDVDQDGATGLSPERRDPTWEGLKLLPYIARVLEDEGIAATAFVRCDRQIRTCLGDALAVRDQCAPSLERVVQAGGELGWHPHLYEGAGLGYRPVRDARAAREQLTEIHAEAARGGLPLKCVRIGEAWHSSECMSLLDQLGVKVDSTALPGRKREDETLRFDWERTPNRPYRPARSDHRVPAASAADSLRILEVPMSTAETRAPYDRAPLRRYLNPAFHSEIFRPGLDAFLGERADSPRTALVLVFHPSELLPGPAAGLCAQSQEVFLSNLHYLKSAIARTGHQPVFHPLGQVLDDWA